jgi:hypothetical protein
VRPAQQQNIMDTNQTAEPAGDSAQAVDHSLEGVLARRMERKEQERQEQPQEAPGGAQDAPVDEPGGEDTPAEPTAGEADKPEGEPSEPEADEAPQDFIPGNALTRMRDGSVRPVGELKKAFDELQELKKASPEIATARQAIEQERAAIQQRAQQLDQLLPYAQEVLHTRLPKPPEPSLRETDPIEWMVQKSRYDDEVAQVNRVAEVARQRQQEQQATQEKAFQEYVRQQQGKLLEAKPELKDPKKAEAFYGQFLGAAEAMGFTRQEADTVYDHRLVNGVVSLWEKAKKWDELQASKATAAKKAEGAAPVQAPGRRLTPGEHKSSEIAALEKRARQSGSIEDVVALRMARQQTG